MGLQDYWNEQGEILARRFRSIRRAHSDSDVKGGRNEVSLALLLAENVHPRRVLTNIELVDSDGVHSDEMDIAICNEWQPFASDSLTSSSPRGSTAQSRSRLGSIRVRWSAFLRTLLRPKRCAESTFRASRCRASMHDVPHFVDRIPYICVAFESALSVDSLCAKLDELSQGSPPEMQPDAIVVVGKCVAMNVRENGGALRFRPGSGCRPVEGRRCGCWTHVEHPSLDHLRSVDTRAETKASAHALRVLVDGAWKTPTRASRRLALDLSKNTTRWGSRHPRRLSQETSTPSTLPSARSVSMR